MFNLTQKHRTYIATLVLSAIVGVIVYAAPSEAIQNRSQYIDLLKQSLAEDRELLTNKDGYKARWNKQEKYLVINKDEQVALNAWVRDLLGRAESKAITLTKLEPAGVQKNKHNKKMSVFIAFEGDMRKLGEFVYQLIEEDPLAEIEALNIKQEDKSKALYLEAMLAKVI